MQMNTESCCDRIETSVWGSYRCKSCGKNSCYLHVSLWTHRVPHCYFCFSPCEAIILPDKLPWVTNTIKRELDDKRRALIVIDGLYIAGMQRHCLDLLDVFNEEGILCTVVTLLGAGGKWADRFLSKCEYLILDLDDSLTWHQFQEITNYQKYEFAVAHLSYPVRWVLNNLPANIRKIAHFHSEFSEHESIPLAALEQVNQEFGLVLFPSMTTLSHYQEKLTSLHFSASNYAHWHVLPNGVPKFVNNVERASDSLSTKRLNISVISRLDHDKFSISLFITTLLHLVDRNLEFTLNLAGDGEAREELNKAIYEASLSSYVKFLGFVDLIEEVYLLSDIVFLPSKRESMPYVMLESIAFGKPIVMPRVGVVRNGNHLSHFVKTFEQENGLDAAEKIIEVYNEVQNHKLFPENHLVTTIMSFNQWACVVRNLYLDNSG
jgi:glycosyltransferase involved in cell wall biosynthesis